ncbi:MAG: type II secretion system minor pseudopilin GspK [Rhodoferax sp.]|uniref:type II secretion system minor pseudopilin GspK n=1 Tax=Rhodoferax sp. TaxID=50421 RepID=UPI00260DB77D|nr:type II secretion system minor pseudopilin GspK [Rhodoferax sp.]MDD2881191.1 type II secretion system minor pseudopilin GspK [Rhodoferax sp.]
MRAVGRSQRGAAILMAMLTVVLVATLASSMMWQQWRGVELESAQRTRVQSAWILTGALDWARLILREDAREGGSDHLAEPWAVPLASARLSTFLAAERGQAVVADDTDPEQEAFLAGHIDDLQARLNVTNLIDNGKLHEPSVAIWGNLFKQLNLPQAELDRMTQQLLLAGSALVSGKVDPLAPLWPASVVDLAWLGLSDRTVQALAPFVTLLPVRTPVNLNTAPVEVLAACVDGLTLAQARQLAQSRAAKPIGTLMDALLVVANPEVKFDAAEHSVASRFFSVTGQLRVGQTTLQERSALQRDGLDVKVLSRTREVVAAEGAPLQ